MRRAAERLGWHLVEMNFLLQPETIDIVRGAGDIKEVLLRISAYANMPLDWENTLIFFDEVEEYPDVMTWVKSGKDYARHVALNNVMSNPEYGIQKAIVLCNDNVSTRGNITYAPIYMLMFIEKVKDDGAKIYKLDLGGLV